MRAWSSASEGDHDNGRYTPPNRESFQNSLCLRVKRSVRSTMSKKAWILSIFQPLLQLLLLFLHSASTAPATPLVQSSSGLSSTYFGVAVTLTCNMTQTSSSLQYSWQLNGSTVQAATSSNTYLVDGDETDSGSYVCVATDGTGSANSAAFSFTVSSVPATPVITHSPVTYGDTVTLTCSTASVGNLTYEFFANNVSVSSKSSNIYLVGQVTFASESTAYTCMVSHSNSHSEKSTDFHLTVKPNKPSIIASDQREDGANLSLTCVSTSDSSTVLTYYWYKDTNLTNHFLDRQTVNFAPLTFSDSGNYRCEAAHGSVVSDKSDPDAIIVKPQTPKVTVNTSSSTVEEGSPVALVCQTKSSTSSRTVTYTWFNENSIPISGPLTSDTLVKSTTNFASAGLYLCSVSIDGIPSDLSADFQLTVQPQAPHVSLLQALPLTDLDTVTLECSSPSIGQNTAGQTLQYTWYLPSGMSSSSQSGRTFTLNVTLAAEGSYTCQVTRNEVASSIGAALNVTVRPRRPSVAPAGEALVDGAQVNLTCNTASTPSTGQPFTYQWLKDGTSYGVTTVRDLELSSLDFSKEGYYTCIIYHKGTPSQSSFVYPLKVQPRRPVVSGRPSVMESNTVTLSCTSPSIGLLNPVTYRWSFNDFNNDQVLAGTDQTYPITSATSAMTGDYSCSVASNGTFSDPSDSFRLEVTPQTPTIASSSASGQPILDQSSVSLMCLTASQPKGLELYTWYFNGIVQTETSVYYNISTVSFAQAGDYNCSVKYDGVASDVSPSYVISVKPQTPTLQLEGTPVDGSSLTLTCTTPSTLPSSDPSRVMYVWSRDGNFANSSSSNRYTFKPTLYDNGDYTCSVMFDSVSSESSASNTIKVRPLTPTVTGATEVQESQNVLLTCSTASQIPSSSLVSYTWYGVSGSAISSLSTDTYSISLASYDASGSYSCEVTCDTATSNRSAAHFLKVKPKTPVISNDENPVLDGGNTILKCTTSSSGDSYKWFDNTGSLVASQSSSTYLINPVTMAKRGSYRCSVVYNSIESSKSDPPFVLLVKPKAPTVSGKPAIDQSPVTLDCSSPSVTASASPTYKWFDNSGNEILQENKKQYTISSVTFSISKSNFQCLVTLNSIESNRSGVFLLEVKPQTPTITGSSIVVEGSGIALSCDTASTLMPSPVVWGWSKDDNPISGASSQQYTSLNAIFSDMAAYTCTVSADGVQSLPSSAFYLSVQPKPATITGNASMPLGDGSPFSLLCSTESSPIDILTYTFTNTDTGVNLATNVIDSSYYLGTVTLETSGSYTCKVTHKGVDSIVSSTPLVLSVKPQTPVVVNSNAQNIEGTDVSLTCSTPSDLSSASGRVIFMWVTPSGNKNSSTQLLTPWQLTFADVGAYSCAVMYRGVESDRSTDYTLQVIPPAPVVSGVAVATQSSSITYTCTTSFASTPSTLSYEWYKDTSLFTGSTSANLFISPVVFTSVGAYICMVTANGVKSDFSQPLNLTVKPQTPTVTAENSLPVPEGGNVSITCRTASERLMTGSVAFTFYDPSDLVVAANVNNKTFTLTSMTLARAGNYKCKVIYNGVSSDVSTTPLLVTVKPAQPLVQTTAVFPVEEGQSLTMSCQTSSSIPAGGVVIYSWRQPGGSVIAGAVSATYILSDVSFAKAGGYQCQVSYNGLPSEYSAVLTVTVKPATPILSGLTGGQAGSSLSLTCSFLSPVDYIVLVTSPGETVIKNLTSNPLTFMPLRLSDGGRYKCRVAKAGVESAYSNEIQLTVQPRTPTLYIYPTSTVADGSSATFTCNSSSQSEMAAEGYNTTLYHSNGATFTSVSPPTAAWPYVITASTAQAGQYACAVTYRQVESSKSSVVNLLVKPPTPTVSLVQAAAVDGSAVSLQCGISNQTGLSSTWTKNSMSSTTSSNTFLTFPAVTFADMGIYTCMLTLNSINSDYSATGYSLVVKPMSPVITGALTVEEGSPLSLTCQPQSSGMPTPVTYSWSRGVTTQILLINAVQFLDAGQITCKVSANGIESSPSSIASVMVQVKKPSLTGPAGLSTIAVDDGSGSVTLNCSTASQVTPTTVTWYGELDAVIQGQSSASYTMASPSLASSGSVKCSLTYNSVESAKSDTISLQVRPRQPVLTGPATAVATNSSVTMTCSSASKPPGAATLTFSWKKDATTLMGETGANLVISPASTIATGQYTCAASYLNVMSLDSSTFRLTVQDPPAQPTIKSSSQLVSVGSKVTLTCETTSTPVTTFTYSWSKDGASLVASGQTLTIDQLKSSDGGTYTCAVVDNSVTSATSNAYLLTVVAPPSKPTVSVSPAAITIGRPLNITCDISPVQSSFTYSWTFNSSALTSTSKTIVITSFQEANVGFYTCVVTLGTQQNASDPRLVATIYAPQSLSLTPAITTTSLVEGDSLTVTCAAACSPTCTFQWSKSGTSIPVSSVSQLSLDVTAQSADIYTCTASNSEGWQTITFNLSVLAAPITPSLSALPSTFPSGQLVTLTCSSTTTRVIASLTYMWLQNDVVLQGQTAPVLQITSFSNEHTGRYVCKAVVASRVSSSSNMLELAPSDAPGKPTVTLYPDVPLENEGVQFSCNATGSSYHWYYNGEVVVNQTEQSYNISAVTLANQGSYACDVISGTHLLRSLRSDAISLTIRYGPSAERVVVRASFSSEAQTLSLVQDGIYNVPPGTQGVITCSANCNEACWFEWYKDSKSMAVEATLTQNFTQVQQGEGNYSCKASNSIDSFSVAFYIRISGSAGTVTASYALALVLSTIIFLFNCNVI